MMWEWTARIQFNKCELGTSFSALIFLGTVPKNPKEWPTATTFVGAHYAFVNSTNCHNQTGEVNDEGFVHLN
ncbi:MAG TPA: hypothetical protein VGO47_11010, partial [Chlamydiales bacterium]|nr:hypothetical protein [Chlamydiales bacterium]